MPEREQARADDLAADVRDRQHHVNGFADPAQQQANMGRQRECPAEQVGPGGPVQRHDGGANEYDGGEAPSDRRKGTQYGGRVVDHEERNGKRETESRADENTGR